MDLINKAKDMVQEGNVGGLLDQARDAVADRVDDIPVVGERLAEMIDPGHNSSDATDTAEDTPEEAEEDAATDEEAEASDEEEAADEEGSETEGEEEEDTESEA